MMLIYFLNGLSFGGLGLAAYLQLRRQGDFPLRRHLPWLAIYGFACGISSWIEMFQASEASPEISQFLDLARVTTQPLIGLFLLIFGWKILARITPLPSWTIFIPAVLIVPIAYAISYAATTFVTPSPIEIPIDIWSRYFFYLPGSVMAGIGFMRQWKEQQKSGYADVANLMLGAGLAFLFEAFVVGLVVPAAPYGPASYYTYDRVLTNAFSGEALSSSQPYMLMTWLDYNSVLQATGLPIQFWRMLSTFAVTFFVVRGLDVFDAIQKRQVLLLERERDLAQKSAYESQILAHKTAEKWTNVLVSINRRIAELENVDSILLAIIENAKIISQSDFIGLALLNEEHDALDLRCYSNSSGPRTVEGHCPIDHPLIWSALQIASSSTAALSEGETLAPGMCPFCDREVRAYAIIQIKLENVPVGVLWVTRFVHSAYSDTDLIWLECMADQVVIAIQHGLMTTQLQSLSVVEERNRIARDMHDGVAQVLGYLNLQLQTLDVLWKQQKSEKFQHELLDMRQAIQQANADVRENILSLRTTLASEKGMASAMAEYITEFGLQTGIEVSFTNLIEGEINLSSYAEVQLVCILQEALTNVRKHAHAGRIQVLLDKQPTGEMDHVLLEVADDGVGFVMHESRGRFGLRTMRERANSVGGDLEWRSAPNQGTTILCYLPCLQPQKLNIANLVHPRVANPSSLEAKVIERP